MLKKFMTLLICASMVCANPVLAKSFGKSGSSSKSSSRSSQSSSKPSKPTQSAGMSRSGVTESVRSGRQNNTSQNNNSSPSNYGSNSGQNNNQNNSNYGNYSNRDAPTNYGSYNQPQRNGYGTGALIGAAAVGALVGYMLHTDNKGNQYYTNPNNPNVAYDSNGNKLSSVPQGNFTPQGTVDVNGNINPASNTANSVNKAVTPDNIKKEAESSFNWLFLLIIALGVLGAIVWFTNRRKPSSPLGNIKPMNTFQDPRTQLVDEADKIFMDIQKNNRPSQISFIQSKVDPVFFDSIKDNVMQESDSKEVTIKSLESEVVDVSQKGSKWLGSVHYRAVLEERNGNQIERQTLNDVWHFTYQDGKWLWAGLEEVEAEESEDIDGNSSYKM